MKTAAFATFGWLVFASALAAAAPRENLTVKLAPDSAAEHEIVAATVAAKPVAANIAATATVEPDANAVAIVATQIPARVVKLVVQPGQQVAAGQPLAILSSMEFGQAKAEYLKSRALADIANQNLKREEDLYARKIASLKDLLEARAAQATAAANYKTARENLRILVPGVEPEALNWSEKGGALSDFALVSPISGTLVKRNLTLGAMVDRNDEPLVVINLDRVWMTANVFEHDLARLHQGARATVAVDAYPKRTFAGSVTYIGDEVDRANRTVQARIEVPNPGHLLKPGMFGHAEISAGGTSEGVVVPESAVFDLGGRKVVFIPEGGGVYRVRDVTLGAAGGGQVEILSGVSPGEQVVSHGGLALKTLFMRTAGE
jgi:cobalt-zinc-cadmium efflux system membrane fusion protein